MDTSLPAPAAAPLRSPVLVAALLAVPGAAYVVWALVPWLRGTLVGPDGGNGRAVICSGTLLLSAVLALAASGTALVTGRGRRRTWAGLAALSVMALAWLVTPAGTALLVAAVD